MKIGDYVRTKDGIIAKITDIIEDLSIDCDRGVFDLGDTLMMEIPWNFKDKYIIKSSPNIIDLIEVGDYVNGYYVEDIRHRYDGEMITILEVATGSNYFQTPIYEDDIKSIVTKEQFEAIKYEIK